jgi:MFS family permease
VGQSIIAANFGLVGALILVDQISIAILVISTFVMGLVFSFIAPARQAWIGELLEGPRLSNGIALQQVAMTATRILGPFLAGALVAIPVSGSGGTYIAMGGLIAIVVITLAQLPASRALSHGRGSPLADLRLGFRHVASRPRLALLVAAFIGVITAGYCYSIVLPGFLTNELGHESEDMAWLLGVAGAAGLVATIGAASLTDGKHAWRLQVAGALLFGGSLVLMAFADNFLQVLGLMLALGAGSSVFQMLNNALVMQWSDPAYYGRVMALVMMAWGLNGIASLPFGLLADGAGERGALLAMGLVVLVVGGATQVVGRMLGPAQDPAAPAVPSLALARPSPGARDD